MDLEQLRYPVGKQNLKEDNFEKQELNAWINTIEAFPQRIKQITKDLSAEQLQWKYRPEGWNIQQLVHHCADSHMNAFVRVKRALTEDTPLVGPYQEALWAEQADVADIAMTIKGQSDNIKWEQCFRFMIGIADITLLTLSKR